MRIRRLAESGPGGDGQLESPVITSPLTMVKAHVTRSFQMAGLFGPKFFLCLVCLALFIDSLRAADELSPTKLAK
jgi:hypothetical protein